MKFRVYSSENWDAHKTVENYPCLKEFGLEIVTGDYEDDAYITLNSLEDLMKLIEAVDYSVIIHEPCEDDNDVSLEIYDDWRE